MNTATSALSMNYSVSVTMDTASMVSSGKVMPSGNDLRVVYKSGSSWVELDREVDGMNTSSTQVWFKTQASIPANGSDNNYYVYYGNPNAGNPPSNKSNIYLWFDDFNRADKPDITAETALSSKDWRRHLVHSKWHTPECWSQWRSEQADNHSTGQRYSGCRYARENRGGIFCGG